MSRCFDFLSYINKLIPAFYYYFFLILIILILLCKCEYIVGFCQGLKSEIQRFFRLFKFLNL